jgi:hypothetical protein
LGHVQDSTNIMVPAILPGGELEDRTVDGAALHLLVD